MNVEAPNEYEPWVEQGMPELAYYQKIILEVSAEVERLRAVLEGKSAPTWKAYYADLGTGKRLAYEAECEVQRLREALELIQAAEVQRLAVASLRGGHHITRGERELLARSTVYVTARKALGSEAHEADSD